MSEWKQRRLENLADTLAFRVQALHYSSFLRETDTLLSLDYASQAAQAPYLFDMAGGILHRGHCRAVPDGSRSTLYAVWELREGDEKLACPRCCPQSSLRAQGQAESAASQRKSTWGVKIDKRISWLRLFWCRHKESPIKESVASYGNHP